MPEPEVNPPSTKRKKLLLGLALIFVVAGVIFAFHWFMVGRYHEATDDAYVGGNVVQITARSEGTVISIHADEMDPVQQGDVLVTLNDADVSAALERSKAQLAQAVRQTVQLQAEAEQQRAVVIQRERELDLAKDTEKRLTALVARKLAAEDSAQQAKISSAIAAANLEVARRQLFSTETLVQGTPLEQQPAVLQAEAELRSAYLAWARSQLPAPVSGYVARRSVQLGQRVNPGDVLMAIAPLEELWVDANFKEDQLAHLRLGQPVSLNADLYGNDIEFHGKVQGIAMGTGASFALLPAQNASGNWIKVVQRVPVRIALDRNELKQHPLRLGLSMRVTVDTHHRDGQVLSTVIPAPSTTPVYDSTDHVVDDMINNIVRSNAGVKANGNTAPEHTQ